MNSCSRLLEALVSYFTAKEMESKIRSQVTTKLVKSEGLPLRVQGLSLFSHTLLSLRFLSDLRGKGWGLGGEAV